tara:strand:- start:41 stop:472 length:432 start_codon:yes stop_codon:yes gene_type:complete
MIDIKKRGLTLDTCFLIQIFKHPEMASFYVHQGLYGKKIYITEIALNEAEHVGFDKTQILLKMNKVFEKIMVKSVSIEERLFGNRLEKTCSTLHSGDSAILAFAKRNNVTLITMDKNLARSCQFFDVDCACFSLVQNGEMVEK